MATDANFTFRMMTVTAVVGFAVIVTAAAVCAEQDVQNGSEYQATNPSATKMISGFVQWVEPSAPAGVESNSPDFRLRGLVKSTRAECHSCCNEIFIDDFESGGYSAWSSTTESKQPGR